MWRKTRIGSLVLAFLLGALTTVLALFGVGALGDEPPSPVLTAVVVVTLVLVAAGLFGLLAPSRKGRPDPPGKRPVQRRATGRRVGDVDLPTLSDFYRNTPDGRLGPTLLATTCPDLDPASDPALESHSDRES